jgi:hypothetical protein
MWISDGFDLKLKFLDSCDVVLKSGQRSRSINFAILTYPQAMSERTGQTRRDKSCEFPAVRLKNRGGLTHRMSIFHRQESRSLTTPVDNIETPAGVVV